MQYHFVVKSLFFFHKLLLSRTATGNSGNFPSQIFRSPTFSPQDLFSLDISFNIFGRTFFFSNCCPLGGSQTFLLPGHISFTFLFHLILSLLSFCFYLDMVFSICMSNITFLPLHYNVMVPLHYNGKRAALTTNP